MKKVITTLFSLIFCIVIMLTNKSNAVSLDTLEVKLDKTKVKPGEEVTVNIIFGNSLGAYTFDIAYDDAIFEYVSINNGTATDNKDKVRVLYYDSTGGNEPKSEMSIKFKAKSELTTSNPTQFLITAEGLANNDASIEFDDITTPITTDILVEPEYIDYKFNLESNGNIIKLEENNMKLSYSSDMGRYYEHARLIAEAKTPKGATVKLLGTDQNGIEHDIIKNGWGAENGYGIGGKNYALVLNVKGVFSEIGDYTITLKLLDKDSNNNSVISEKSFDFKVLDKTITPEQNSSNTESFTKEETIKENIAKNTTEKNTVENSTDIPKILPKTGINIYIPIGILLVVGLGIFIYCNKRK